MVKAIIVDDEQMTRNGLLNYVDWKSAGIEVVGEATDGLEGLDLAKSTSPDIAVCDVRMPKMDGIKLAEHLKELLPNCKIIFLSGYSDKEYLKSAIQIKAVDYIEKPVNLKEFQELLRKTAESCREDRRKISYFQSSLLTHLIKDEIVDFHRVKDGLRHIDVQLPLEGRYFCMIFKLSDNQYEQDILQKISIEFKKENLQYLSGTDQNEIIVIASILEEEKMEVIKTICSKLVKDINDENKMALTAGIGDIAEGISDIGRSYNQAKEALKSVSKKSKSNVGIFDPNKDKAIIRSIEAYIEHNYSGNITINSIASAVYLTPQYLCILYKKETGKTVNDYLTEVRMEAAKELLKNPTLKLYEVAGKVGFNDPNYFAKVFKKAFGYKPSEYRDRN
jgi:two-component system, response regulator YesN